MMLVLVVMVAAFGYWYKYKKQDSKWFGGAESRSLLREQAVNYADYQPLH